MKIKILQWNIWYKEELSKNADFVKKYAPDILCVQELMEVKNKNINNPEKLYQLLDKRYDYFYQVSATWDNRINITNQGNGIYSRFPILSKKHSYVSRFKHNPLNASDEGRVYMEIDIKVGEKILTVSTTHLSYTPDLEITEKRKKEATKLSDILKKKENKFIFTADLNASPDSYVVKQILKNGNLKNAGPDFEEKSWPTKPFNYHGHVEEMFKWRADYVFTTKDLKVISSDIIKTDVSDHFPILTVIDF